MRSTHTVAVLELSKAAFDEIAHKMREAGYDHAFVEEFIDLNGVAVACEAEKPVRPVETVNEHGQRFFKYPPADLRELGCSVIPVSTNIPALQGVTLELDADGFTGVGSDSAAFNRLRDQVADAMAERPFADDVQR